jgi:sec-independent protein translocase protein TatA
MPNIGPLEIAIVLVIVLIIFGPKRLPGLGKQLGTGMREFKESITGQNKDRDDEEGPSAVRRDAEAALGRPDGEPTPLKDDSVRERSHS